MQKAVFAVCACLSFSISSTARADIKAMAVKGGELTGAEKAAIEGQKRIMDEIMKLFAERALDRPKDFAGCAQEMFAMRYSGKCRDKHTHYYSPQDAKEHYEDLNGVFGGIGVEIAQEGSHIVVVAPFPGTPAERAGVEAMDIILKIDGKTPKNVPEVKLLVRGKPGTRLTLVVFRKKIQKELVFKITREAIIVPMVKWRVFPADPKIGIIKIAGFDKSAPLKFGGALIKLARRGVRNIVIDLRNNPGGWMDGAIKMLSLFSQPSDTLLTVRFRASGQVYNQNTLTEGQMQYRFITLLILDKILKNKSLGDIGVVILINNGSASASEILAGTMKDWGYPVIGEKSFGKGVGQNLYDLSDGSILMLTTFEFLVGNGKTAIRDKGVAPTIEVRMPERKPGERVTSDKDDPQLMKAVEVLRSCGKKNAAHKCTR